MAAAMADRHRMISRHFVQILTGERAALGGFGVIVFETEDPLARRCLGSALGDGCLNLGDGTEVAIHFPQMPQTGRGGMAVRVDESGNYRFSAQIDALGPRACEPLDVCIRT